MKKPFEKSLGKKVYGTECANCGHRIGVHFVNFMKGTESCNGYVRKDQPNYDGKKCDCKCYVRPKRGD